MTPLLPSEMGIRRVIQPLLEAAWWDGFRTGLGTAGGLALLVLIVVLAILTRRRNDP